MFNDINFVDKTQNMCVCVCACDSACAVFPVGDLLHFPSCSHVMSRRCMASLGLDEVVHSGLFSKHCHVCGLV